MKIKLEFWWYDFSTWVSCRVDDIRYASDDVWLSLLLVSTWVFCAYVASI